MGYSSWFEKHAQKHYDIVQKLLQKGYDKQSIIEYFCYENMQKNEVDFCPLYAKNRRCHNIEKLNCYLCACPNFRFSDDGIDTIEKKTRYSLCSIDSKDGRVSESQNKIHHDCSLCDVAHKRAFIDEVFDIDWKVMMQECKV